MWCVVTLHATLFNEIKEDNRRVILNQERTWFSFSETSFEKKCHKRLTRVVHPEKVASRIRHISTQPHFLLTVAHVLIAKNGGIDKEYVSCNLAIRLIFGNWLTHYILLYHLGHVSLC